MGKNLQNANGYWTDIEDPIKSAFPRVLIKGLLVAVNRQQRLTLARLSIRENLLEEFCYFSRCCTRN